MPLYHKGQTIADVGAQGIQGENGQDGFSPTVSTHINDDGDGTVVTITDVDGEHSFTVLNGENGVGVPAGGTENQILAKSSNEDYDTKWVDMPSGGNGDKNYLVKAPVGTIVIWSGTTDNIPTGWALCDGQDGRPDLRDKFVLGAGAAHNVRETGGSEEVTLTVSQIPSHNHKTYYKNVLTPSGTSQYVSFANTLGAQNLFTSDTGYTGNSLPHPNMPPYYTLCYIIKISADETDGEVYSTEETRIGTWIDGKPLYRQTISAISPSSVGTTTQSITTLPIKVNQITNIYGVIKGSASNQWTALPCYYNTGAEVWVTVSTSQIDVRMIVRDAVYTSKPVFITIEYAKTND